MSRRSDRWKGNGRIEKAESNNAHTRNRNDVGFSRSSPVGEKLVYLLLFFAFEPRSRFSSTVIRVSRPCVWNSRCDGMWQRGVWTGVVQTDHSSNYTSARSTCYRTAATVTCKVFRAAVILLFLRPRLVDSEEESEEPELSQDGDLPNLCGGLECYLTAWSPVFLQRYVPRYLPYPP